MTTAEQFRRAAIAFARAHPAAVLAMEEPELAVDPRARMNHLRRTCQIVRAAMQAHAKLSLRPAARKSPACPDLFEADQAQRHHA